MQELEDLEGFRVGAAGAEEEQLVLDDGVEQRRGVGVGQVDQRRARRGVREVERQEGAAGGRAVDVGVLEQRCAALY